MGIAVHRGRLRKCVQEIIATSDDDNRGMADRAAERDSSRGARACTAGSRVRERSPRWKTCLLVNCIILAKCPGCQLALAINRYATCTHVPWISGPKAFRGYVGPSRSSTGNLLSRFRATTTVPVRTVIIHRGYKPIVVTVVLRNAPAVGRSRRSNAADLIERLYSFERSD